MRQKVSQALRIAVLGATGGTGRHVVTQALERGHNVVAVVRRPGSFERTDRLSEAVWSAPTHVAGLASALAGVDVVISALGGAAKGPTTVCTDGIRAALAAMGQDSMSRLIVVSAHGVLETHDRSLYSKAVWSGVAEKMKDKESMEALITASSIAWTIVRPPMLKDTRATGTYQVGANLPIRLWHSIGREDLASFLVEEAENPQFIRGYPRIHR
ncbi:NAD(P)H-binding protein [Glaciihabitans sp. UYNi722]|uniref:NAD(P)-dependent oxidoreductase n=1 Tax=Glaciihabitans sp. UYNi722 TaxID=3156344 RepID=UPI003397426F